MSILWHIHVVSGWGINSEENDRPFELSSLSFFIPAFVASSKLSAVTLPNSRNLNDNKEINRFLKSNKCMRIRYPHQLPKKTLDVQQTFCELFQPFQLALNRAIQATHHNTCMFACKLARCLPYI